MECCCLADGTLPAVQASAGCWLLPNLALILPSRLVVPTLPAPCSVPPDVASWQPSTRCLGHRSRTLLRAPLCAASYCLQVAGLEGNRQAIIDALSPLGPGSVLGGEGAIYFFARLPKGGPFFGCCCKGREWQVARWMQAAGRRARLGADEHAGHSLLFCTRVPSRIAAEFCYPCSVLPTAGCEDDEAVVRWLVRKHKVCLIPGTSCGRPGHVRAAFANLKPEVCAEAAARLKVGLQELVVEGMPAVHAFLQQDSRQAAPAAVASR